MSESPPTHEKDPLEAIYALNIGDFLVDSFISDDLLDKISDSLADDPSKLKRQLEELVQIYSMDKTLKVLGFSKEQDFLLYDSVAATLTTMFEMDACHIFQTVIKDTGEEYLSLTGTSATLTDDNRWQIGFKANDFDLVGKAYLENETIIISDLSKEGNWKPIVALEQNKSTSLLATPMYSGRRRLGMLVFESHEKDEFSEELVTLAQAVSKVFNTALDLQNTVSEAEGLVEKENATINELQSSRAQITESIGDLGLHQQEFLTALGAAVDARNQFTKGHSQCIANIAQTISETIELGEKTTDLVYFAGLVGSIGKIHIPADVMAKKESLSAGEWESLREHPNVGVNLLLQINFLSEIIPYVHYQQERWDGSGSPEGLKGKSIPFGSRILALANAYYALTNERPYRGEVYSHEKALQILQEEAGSKWDPFLVETLCNIPADSLM